MLDCERQEHVDLMHYPAVHAVNSAQAQQQPSRDTMPRAAMQCSNIYQHDIIAASCAYISGLDIQQRCWLKSVNPGMECHRLIKCFKTYRLRSCKMY